jgi:hypothetical protein
MSDYDPSELLLVCDSIIEDGELTYDELYQLAEWLNSHREACVHWPGSLLVEPLQRTWETREYVGSLHTKRSWQRRRPVRGR